jgi:hypothetical protein
LPDLIVKASTRSAIGKLTAMQSQLPLAVAKFTGKVSVQHEAKAKALYRKRLAKNSKQTGALGATFRRTVRQDSYTLEFGGNEPQKYWWEWGGSTRSPRGNTERKRMKSGRTVFPAWRAIKKDVKAEAEETLEDLNRNTGI